MKAVAGTEPSGGDRRAADGVQETLPTIDDSCAGSLGRGVVSHPRKPIASVLIGMYRMYRFRRILAS